MTNGEVIALDTDGCIVQWNAETCTPYNCGENPEQFGIDNLTDIERERIASRPLDRSGY